MNMTVVIISKRSVELLALLVLLLGVAGATEAPAAPAPGAGAPDDLPAAFAAVADEQRQMDDRQLGSMVRDFGEHLRDTMEGEMERLMSEELERPAATAAKSKRERELERLKRANRAASEDIRDRVGLAGDNEGALPQMGLGSMAATFAAAASDRLTAAGSYIGHKIRSLSQTVDVRIPPKLRRFFKWPTFLRFKIRFHKTYKSLREELYRQMIFLRSHIVVGMQSVRFLLGRDKHLLGPNQYADWTEREYLEKEGNHAGERSAADVDASAQQALDERQKARLEQLAASGQTIFGRPIVGAGGKLAERKSRRKRQAGAGGAGARESKRQRRVRREADDYEMDELDDHEDDEEELDFEGMDLGNELENGTAGQEEGDVSGDTFKLVEEFANDLDISGLDDLEANLDEALNANDDFKPIDLRETGCIIKAENQNGCGCCYSYALHAAASYYNCMEQQQDKPDRYHARFVADCGRYLTPEGRFPAINSCHGGRISKAYAFAQLVGVQRFSYYNIARVSAKLADPEACVYPRPADLANHGWQAVIEPVPMFQRSRFALLRPEEVDLHLRTVGPVVVNARTWKNFRFYEAGILADIEEAELSTLHSMLIVGHDKDAKGRDYWIILNSHGIVWGERGFLRVYHDALENFAVIYGGLAPLDP